MDVLFTNPGSQGLAGMVNNGDCKSKATIEISSMVQADDSVSIRQKNECNKKTKWRTHFRSQSIITLLIDISLLVFIKY